MVTRVGMDTKETRAHESPAADAAGLLLRIGFGILVLGAPVAAIYSRRAFVVLVPIGALLIGTSALILDAPTLFQRIRAALMTPGGALMGLFFGWLVLSLIWTPFPAPAAERAFRTLGNVLMALTVASALPERMRASNLHLMTIGVVLATIALSVSALIGPIAFRTLQNPEAPTFGRAAVAASIMVWPAVAWTFIRGRDWQGLALIAVSAIATATSGSLDAVITLVAALAVFMAARAHTRATGAFLAIAFAGVLLLAPFAAFLAKVMAGAFGLGPDNLLSEIGLWAAQIAQEPARLLTGHGFDTSHRAQVAGLVNPAAPDGLLPTIWFDLGLPGAGILAGALYFTFRSLGHLPQPLAPAAMAVLAGGLLFAVVDPTATQAWWLSICVVASVMLVAVRNGQYRTARPAAIVTPGAPGLNGVRISQQQ
jgi:hypothetical protein